MSAYVRTYIPVSGWGIPPMLRTAHAGLYILTSSVQGDSGHDGRKNPHYAIFSDEAGSTGLVDEKFTVVHWNGSYGTEHTAKVRDQYTLAMDYSYKEAALGDKPKYDQPKVNLLRSENNATGTITLHETTVEGQGKRFKFRDSVWTKVQAPDDEFLAEMITDAKTPKENNRKRKAQGNDWWGKNKKTR